MTFAITYPRLVRNQFHDFHDYTLWLTESVQMRLSVEEYENLKNSIADEERPVDVAWLRGELAAVRAERARERP